MMNMINRLSTLTRRKQQPRAAAIRRTPEIIRTFVETGDERCPIAGIWSCIGMPDTAPDEPESIPPVMRTPLPWRASDFLFTFLHYSIS
jgi:hypothetical protein